MFNMQIFIIVCFLSIIFRSAYSLPIKNNLVIAKLTDEQISIATRALRNDIRFAGPINKEISQNAIANDGYRWPNGVIYYSIDYELREYKLLFDQTLAKMTEEIGVRSDGSHCISFIPRTNQHNYLSFNNGSEGCWSYVGRRFSGEQSIMLSEFGCLWPGTIIHEAMHAIGFFHEHQRSDRNAYVDIHYENMGADDISQFDIHMEARLFAPFDYDSIMIYGNKAFSHNDRDTIVAKNGQELLEPYYKTSLTYNNIRAIRELYGCESEIIDPLVPIQPTEPEPLLISTESSSSSQLSAKAISITLASYFLLLFY